MTSTEYGAMMEKIYWNGADNTQNFTRWNGVTK